MIWQIDLAILTLVVICSLGAIMIKDLLGATILFGAYSFMMCLLWAVMGAVDVAFTEASVGAGRQHRFFSWPPFFEPQGGPKIRYVNLIIVILTGCVLAYTTVDFPNWGDPDSPAAVHVSPYYVEHTIEDTAVPNVVTSVLADYRGFDTMFETTVVFAAGLACFLLLRTFNRGGVSERLYRHCSTDIIIRIKDPDMEVPDSAVFEACDPLWTPHDLIIRTICRLMVPFLQLFALYVVAHGHHSPGGGFQGGVILGAGFILLAISYDLRTARRRFREMAPGAMQRRRGTDLCRRRRLVPGLRGQLSGLWRPGQAAGDGPGHGPVPRHIAGGNRSGHRGHVDHGPHLLQCVFGRALQAGVVTCPI